MVADSALWFLFLLPFGLLTYVLVPLLIFLLELPAVALLSFFSGERFVEAAHGGPPSSRMTWRVPAALVAPVADQVTRQLELGYERIQPHNARFVGFG